MKKLLCDFFNYSFDVAIMYLVLTYAWGLELKNIWVLIGLGLFGRYAHFTIMRMQMYRNLKAAEAQENAQV